jgi:hypothetical protein
MAESVTSLFGKHIDWALSEHSRAAVTECADWLRAPQLPVNFNESCWINPSEQILLQGRSRRMTAVETLVQGYYGRSDLLQRIEAALREVAVDPQKPGFHDLQPFDQIHGRGILATEEHAARAGVRAGM